jgi:hypothetical protein
MLQGGCHCGAIRYQMSDQVKHHSLCHCRDCRVCAGAPVVAWAAVEKDGLRIDGEPSSYQSSEHATRLFCGRCGTGLFYVNEMALPGLIDIQTATLDDPDALPLQLHVQTAERIGWMETAHELPQFQRYPG